MITFVAALTLALTSCAFVAGYALADARQGGWR